MAYLVKYRLSYLDYLGNSKKIDIEQDGYASTVIEVAGTDNPLKIKTYGEGDDKFSVIHGSEAIISLLSTTDFKFTDLFSADARKNRVKVYTGSTLYWIGYILPDIYLEPYVQPTYPVSISAGDGLGQLRNFLFVDGSGDPYTTNKHHLEILTICLNKLDLGLNIWESINIYENSQNSTTADSPLNQTYVDCEIFKNSDDSIMNCYQVVEEILKIWGARILLSQDGSNDCAWHIIRVGAMHSSYQRRKFNSAGVYQSTESYNPVLTITNASTAKASRRVFINESQMLEFLPAWKEFTTIQKLGLREILPKNGNFDLWTDVNTPTYWTKSVGLTTNLKKFIIDNDNLGAYLVDSSSTIGAAESITAENIAVEASTITSINIEFRVRPIRAGFTPSASGVIYFEIILGTWRLTSSGWLNSPANKYVVIEVDGADPRSFDWISVVVADDNIPITGNISIKIYEHVTSVVNSGLVVDYARLTLSVNDVVFEDTEEITTTVDSDNNFVPDNINLLMGDVPETDNATAVYNNPLLLSDDSFTDKWSIKNHDWLTSLLNLLRRIYYFQHLNGTQILRGVIKGDVKRTTVYTDAKNPGHIFMTNGIEMNDKYNENTLELIEIFTTTTTTTTSTTSTTTTGTTTTTTTTQPLLNCAEAHAAGYDYAATQDPTTGPNDCLTSSAIPTTLAEGAVNNETFYNIENAETWTFNGTADEWQMD
jgi:hypothetical protein